MLDDIATVLKQYAYLAIFVGAFFEGESTLLLSGLAAGQGRLSFVYVVVAGALGGFSGDQTHFWTGRLVGRRILLRRPKWLKQSDRLLGAFARHQTLFLLGFRFLYGLRTLASVALGTCGLHPGRFATFNAFGATFWALAVTSLGYFFGERVLHAFAALSVERALIVAALLGTLLGLLWALRRARARRTAGAACVVSRSTQPDGADNGA